MRENYSLFFVRMNQPRRIINNAFELNMDEPRRNKYEGYKNDFYH